MPKLLLLVGVSPNFGIEVGETTCRTQKLWLLPGIQLIGPEKKHITVN